MKRGLRLWFYAEAIIGMLTSVLFVYTLFARNWIEMVFHIDPDKGQGGLEWLIVAAVFALAMSCGYLARREWRRASVAAA